MSAQAPHTEPSPEYDSSDPDQVQERKRQAAYREKARLDVIAGVMESQAGRAWIWDELVAGHVFRTSFEPGDALTMAFREGERNAGLRLFADINRAAPDQYVIMQRENAA